MTKPYFTLMFLLLVFVFPGGFFAPVLPPDPDMSDPLINYLAGPSITWIDPNPYTDMNIPHSEVRNISVKPIYIHPFYRSLEGTNAGIGVYDVQLALLVDSDIPFNGFGGPLPRCNRLIYLETPGPKNTTVPVLMMVGVWSYCNTTRQNLITDFCYLWHTHKNDPSGGPARGVSALSYDGGVTWVIGAYDPRLARCDTATVTIKIGSSNTYMACLIGGYLVPWGEVYFGDRSQTHTNVCTYDGIKWFDIANLPIPAVSGTAAAIHNDNTLIYYGAAKYANRTLMVASVAEYLTPMDCSSFLYHSSYYLSRCINITDWVPIQPPVWAARNNEIRLAPIIQYYPYGIQVSDPELTNYSAPLLLMAGGFQRIYSSLATPDRKIWVLLMDQLTFLRQKLNDPLYNRSQSVPLQWTFMSESMPFDVWNSYNALVLLDGNISASTDLFSPNGMQIQDPDEDYIEKPRFSCFVSRSAIYTFFGLSSSNDLQSYSASNMDLIAGINDDDGTYGKYIPQPPFPSMEGVPFVVVDMIMGTDPRVKWNVPVLYVLTDYRLYAGYTARCIFRKCIIGEEYPVPCKYSIMDASCTSCKVCENHQYVYTPCSYQLLALARLPLVRDTVCSNCTVCADTGRTTLAPCTKTTDTVCGPTFQFYTNVENILASSLRVLFDYLFTGISVLFIVGSIGLLIQAYTTAQQHITMQRTSMLNKFRDMYGSSTDTTKHSATASVVYFPRHGNQVPNLFLTNGTRLPMNHPLRAFVGNTTVPESGSTVPSTVVNIGTINLLLQPPPTVNDRDDELLRIEDTGVTLTDSTITSNISSFETFGTPSNDGSSQEGSIVPLSPRTVTIVPSVLQSSSTNAVSTHTNNSSSPPSYFLPEAVADLLNIPSNPWSVLCGVRVLRNAYFGTQLAFFSTYLGCLYTISHWCLAFALPIANDVRGGIHSEGYAVIATSLLWIWGVCACLCIGGISYIVYRETRQGKLRGDMEFHSIAVQLEKRETKEALVILTLFTVIHPRCIFLAYFFPLLPKRIIRPIERYVVILTSVCEVINLALVLVVGNWLSIPVAQWGRLLSTCGLLGFVFVFLSFVQLLLDRYTSSIQRTVWIPNIASDTNNKNNNSYRTNESTDGTSSIHSSDADRGTDPERWSRSGTRRGKDEEVTDTKVYTSPIPNSNAQRRSNLPATTTTTASTGSSSGTAINDNPPAGRLKNLPSSSLGMNTKNKTSNNASNSVDHNVTNPLRSMRVSQMFSGSTNDTNNRILSSPTLSIGDNVIVQYPGKDIEHVSITSMNEDAEFEAFAVPIREYVTLNDVSSSPPSLPSAVEGAVVSNLSFTDVVNHADVPVLDAEFLMKSIVTVEENEIPEKTKEVPGIEKEVVQLEETECVQYAQEGNGDKE